MFKNVQNKCYFSKYLDEFVIQVNTYTKIVLFFGLIYEYGLKERTQS